MRLLYSLFVFCVLSFASHAQNNWEWVSIITSSNGDVNCESITEDDNGNLYVVGSFNGTAHFDSLSLTSQGGSDFFVAKLNASGDFIWVKKGGGVNNDGFIGITYKDGYIYTSGYFSFFGSFDSTHFQSIGGDDLIISKIDTSGNLKWIKTGGSISNNFVFFSIADKGNKIEINSKNEIILSGSLGNGIITIDTISTTTTYGGRGFLAKFDTSGSIINLNLILNVVDKFQVAIDSNNNIIAPFAFYNNFGTGVTSLTTTFNDSTFTVLRNSNVASGNSTFKAIEVDNLNNHYLGTVFNAFSFRLGPSFYSTSGGEDFIIAGFSDQSTLTWVKQFGGSGNDRVTDFFPASQGIYACGHFNTSASFDNFVVSSPGQSIFITKIDTLGNVEWVKTGAEGVGVTAKNLLVDDQSQIFVSGDFLGQVSFDGTIYSGQAFRDGYIAKLGCKPDNPQEVFGDTSVCLDTSRYFVSNLPNTSHFWTLDSGGTLLNSTGDTCLVVWNNVGKFNLSVIATNSCGNSLSTELEVKVKSNPITPIISGDSAVCLGTHLLEVSNQESAIYNWQNTGSAIKINLGNNRLFTYSNAQFDTISVSSTNSCGTSKSGDFVIEVKSTPINSPVINGSNSICSGQNIFIISNPSYDGNYMWNSPGGVINNQNDTAFITFSSGGNYSISAYENNECGNGPPTNFNVNVIEKPALASGFTGDLNPCKGVENYSINPQPGVTYSWSLDSGGAIIPIGNSASVLWNKKGSYNISVQGSNQCGSGSILVNPVIINDVPIAPNEIIGEDTVCIGPQQYLVNLKNSNAIWSLTGGGALNTSSNKANINWVTPGTYILSSSASNVCGVSNSISKIVFVDTLSNLISNINGSTQNCIDTADYGVNFQSGITYNWSLDSGGILVDSSNTARVIWQETGVFNLKISTNNGCNSNKLIEIIGKPNALNSVVGDSLVCTGNSAFSFTPEGNINYNWATASNTNIISLGSNAFVNWANSGLDTIYITGSNQCELDTVFSLPINIKATPTLNNLSGDSLLCKGNIINYQTTFDSSYTYSWLSSGGTISNSGNMATINWLDSGVFSIQVSASNFCGSSSILQKSIEVLSSPKPPNNLFGKINPCLNTETYSIQKEPNQTYQWVLGNGGNLSFNNDTAVVNWTQSGSQNLVVIPQSNCGQGTPKTFSISVHDVPKLPALISDSILCLGANLFQASSINSDSIFWKINGAISIDTTESLFNYQVDSIGSSNVIISSKNNCGFGDSLLLNLSFIDVIAPTNIIGDSTSCLNLTSFASPLDTNLGYLWNVSGGGILSAQNNIANVNWLAAGNFEVELKVSNKCGIGPVLKKQVLVSTKPPLPILTQGDLSPCLGSETFEVFNFPNGKYNWIVDSTNFYFDTTQAIAIPITNINSFNLKSFTSNQCGTSDTLTSIISPIDVPSFKPSLFGDSVLCVGGTEKYNVNNGGFNILWSSTGGGLLNPLGDSCFVTATQQGSFSLIATSSNKCGLGKSDSLHFKIQDIPQIPSVIQGNLKTCIGVVDSFFTNAPDADSIFWSINGGGQISGNKNFAIANWQNAGTFLLEAKPKNFCGTGSSRVAIVETSKLPEAPTVVQGDTFVCTGSTTYIVATTTPANYIWQTNHVFNIQPKGNTAKIDFDTTGNFNLKIISSNYCGVGDSTQLNIEVLGLPNRPAQILGEDSLCLGADLQFITKKSGESYLWNLTSGGGLIAQNDTVKLNWTTPGDHQLSVQAQNVCGTSSTLQKTVHVDGFPTQPSFTVQNKKSCVLDTAVYFANPGFGQSLSWFVDGGSILDQKDDSVKIVWEQTGDKILSAFSKNLCGLSAPSSIVMVINKLPQLNTTLIGERQVCINTTQEYQIASTDLTSYNWQFNKAQNSAVDNFAFAKWTESGFDTISVTASNYCGLEGPLLYPIEILDPPTQPVLAFENGFLKSNVNQEISLLWYFEGKTISGAQDSIYEPTRPGYYQIGISNICDSVILSRKYLIGFDTENIGFVIYPNPARNEVNVEIPLNINWEAVQILNSVGQVMYEETNKGFWKLNFDLEFLPQGFYLVRIKSEFGLHTKKFTKS